MCFASASSSFASRFESLIKNEHPVTRRVLGEFDKELASSFVILHGRLRTFVGREPEQNLFRRASFRTAFFAFVSKGPLRRVELFEAAPNATVRTTKELEQPVTRCLLERKFDKVLITLSWPRTVRLHGFVCAIKSTNAI